MSDQKIKDIFKYYNRMGSNWNIWIKHDKLGFSLLILTILMPILVLVLCTFGTIGRGSTVALMVFSILLMSVGYIFYSIKQKEFLKKHYYGMSSMYEIKVNILRAYLYKKKIRTKEQLEFLVRVLKSKSEKKKRNLNLWFAPLFLTLLVPLWNSMLSERAKKVKDWSTFLELFEATAILVIIMLIFIGLFRIIWYLIKKSFNAKSELYSEMANIIEEEILFEKIK